MPKKKPNKPEAGANECAVRLLARREHSRAELRYKLRGRGLEDAEIQPALDELEDRGWQSDERYAEAKASSRISAGYGPLRIAAELSLAGVTDVLVDRTMAALEVDWFAQIAELHQRRFGERPTTGRQWQQQCRFLQTRGFTGEQIRSVLGEPIYGD